jgi:hypothetical protein
VSAKTICEAEACLLPEERPPPPGSETGPGGETGPRPDGPPTTLPDGAPLPDADDADAGDPVVTGCESSTGRLASADIFPTARLVTASSTTLFYVKGETPDTVHFIAKTGGKEGVAFKVPAGGTQPRIRAIAVDGAGVVVGWEENGTRKVKPTGLAETVIATSTAINDVAAAPDSTQPRIYASTTNEVFFREPAGTWDNPSIGIGAIRLFAVMNYVYYVNGSGVLNRFQRNLMTSSPVTGGAPLNALFYRQTLGAGVNTLHVAGSLSGPTRGVIGTVSNATISPIYSNLSEVPLSIHEDGAYYVYHAGNSIYRIDMIGNGLKSVITTDPAGLDHVVFDEEPLGCIYYWRKIGAGGRLIIRKKQMD